MHLIKDSNSQISDIISLEKELRETNSDIIKALHFDFDFSSSLTTYLSPKKITYVIYFRISKIKAISILKPRILQLYSDFKEFIEEKFSNSPFKIISYTQSLNSIQIEFKCDKTLFSGFEKDLLKNRFFYCFHSLLDKFKFKFCQIKENISDKSIEYVYRICLERRKYNILDFGICKASKNLFQKYLRMVLKATKLIEEYHHLSLDDVYIECEDGKKLSSLTWIFYSIGERDGWNPLVFLGSDKENLTENDLWIPRKEDLEKILFNFEIESDLKPNIWDRDIIGYTNYKNWRRKHKVSIKCEEINYLAYLIKRDYNRIWDDKEKEWSKILTPEQIFKINNYLTLKLEYNRTNIYVKDKPFIICKYLLFSFSKEELSEYEEINSIDEIKHKYDQSHETQHHKISPEVEFWGHCSNLQAWYENEYDTRLLHSNLAFPLLKKLTKCGDPLARKVFKEEIALRFESNFSNVISFLLNTDYLSFLNLQEIETLYNNLDFSKWEIAMINTFFSQWYDKVLEIKDSKKEIEITKKYGEVGLEKISQLHNDAKKVRKEVMRKQLNKVNVIEN